MEPFYELSPLEKIREANLKRNHAEWERLGFVQIRPEPRAHSTATKRKITEEAEKKSRRLQLANEQKEQAFDEEECGMCGEKYYFVRGKNRGNVRGGHNSHCRHNERSNSSANKSVNDEADIDERCLIKVMLRTMIKINMRARIKTMMNLINLPRSALPL